MSTGFEQGLARGKVESRAIHHLLAELYRLVDFYEIDKKEFLNIDEQLRFVPQRYLDECRGIADGAGVLYEEIAAMNFSNLISRIFRSGCTSFLIPKSHTEDGSVMLLKNRDLGFRRIHPQVLTYSHLEGFKQFLGVTTASNVIWYQGVNENGLVAFNNNSPCEAFDPPKAQGIPVGVAIRRLLEECSTVEDALKLIQTTRHSVCSNVFIADRERAVIAEVKAGLDPFVWPIDKPSCRANHYLLHTNPEPKNADEILTRNSSMTRYETGKLLLKDKQRISLEDLQRISRDHSQGPSNSSICRHAPIVGTPLNRLMASVTLSGQIFKLGPTIETYTALGRPCQVEYVRVAFGDPVPEPLESGSVWLENNKTKD